MIRKASANSAPFGQRLARAANNMENSDRLSERLVRLPLAGARQRSCRGHSENARRRVLTIVTIHSLPIVSAGPAFPVVRLSWTCVFGLVNLVGRIGGVRYRFKTIQNVLMNQRMGVPKAQILASIQWIIKNEDKTGFRGFDALISSFSKVSDRWKVG
jgi:hypothetical protein